jgi:hypothetical protein
MEMIVALLLEWLQVAGVVRRLTRSGAIANLSFSDGKDVKDSIVMSPALLAPLARDEHDE